MKTAKWLKKLTASERKHLRETIAGTPTFRKFKGNFEHQVAEGINCWECRHIAVKLGLQKG